MNSRPKSYHHGNLKEELLRVAIETGREAGPEAISIRNITRRLGVSPTSAYRHYSGQAELSNAVSEKAVEALVSRLDEVIDDHEKYPLAAERLLACGYAYFDFAIEEPNFFRCMLEGNRLDLITTDHGGALDAKPGLEFDVISKFSRCLEVHARQTDGTSHLEFFFHNALAAWSTIHGFAVLCTTGQMAGLSKEEKRSLAVPVFSAALRGTDFHNPHNAYRNYPGGVAPESDEALVK
ncbi:hypothetical protein CPHO_04680 [Corynebacterium phocae]|uniref:HTH tetR-type domain-containing protein n=1 Tax=Corynebacterium phocae TaxID=161895 RepID=A0A1L7D2T6_9CORY|nr:TetR/AcrR family transcriptional regulator [Corynebacterium phocae]APT92301.1 hypothetical protein CPHO_04680 [Corynebacterium phocae]KAA8725335.1 TetR/AcrR family transcriptional regulator [Corynebacterium phocae]